MVPIQQKASMVGELKDQDINKSPLVDTEKEAALVSNLNSFLQAGGSTTLSSYTPYNNSYDPRFFVRTEEGTVNGLTDDELNAYGTPARQQVWAVGIRSRYGIIGFYVNDQDSTWGHGQYISFPVLANGSLPAFNRPILSHYLRLWVQLPNGTWFRNWITSRSLYQANAVDIRLSMVAVNTSTYLELGWTNTLTIQGFDFEIYNGIRLYYNDQNQIHYKANITTIDRGWAGVGLEYVLYQSTFWDGTDWEIRFVTATNDTHEEVYELNAFVDVLQNIPAVYNESTLMTADFKEIHNFNWQDMRDAGLDTTIFTIEQLTLPNNNIDWVLRVGMYRIATISQGSTLSIDPSETITSDASAAVPHGVSRDSSGIPYILAIIGTTFKIFKGDAQTPTTWSSKDFGTQDGYGSLIIGEYSGTEYIWAFRIEATDTLICSYATVSAYTFTNVTIDSTASGSYLDADYDATGEILGVSYGDATKAGDFEWSDDGGATWSGAIDLWSFSGGDYVRGASCAFNGSHWFVGMGVGSQRNGYIKRWSSGGGLEYYTAGSWTSTDDTTYGTATGGYGGDWSSGQASANIIIMVGTYFGGQRNSIQYSRDGGETWSGLSGMGTRNYDYGADVALLVNDDFVAVSSNYDSNGNDLNDNVYDYSAPSESGWSLIEDSGDTVDLYQKFVITQYPNKTKDWIDIVWEHVDDSASTSNLTWYNYQIGEVDADTDPPQFTYDYPATANQNNSAVALFTTILVNWSITDASPSNYWIYSNETGTGNISRVTGTYTSGSFKSWSYDNDNTSMVGLTVFFQIVANDTGGYYNSSIVFFSITSIFSLTIDEATFNWTTPNVVKGSGAWVYIDIPAKQYLNLSVIASGSWEIRAYYNETDVDLHVKAYITDNTGGTMPEVETFWDSAGIELTGSEQVITGGDNQPAGDYSTDGDNYAIWLVVQVDEPGESYYGILLTLVIYSE
jgi:hypothetical protein